MNPQPPASTQPVSVLVVDDDTDQLDSLCLLVGASPRLSLAGSATNTTEALRLLERSQVDVVLADVRMPGPDGISLTRTVTSGRRDHRPRVVVLTAFALDHYLLTALGGGASGFFPKTVPWDQLEAALIKVDRGGVALPAGLSERAVNLALPGQAGLDQLSARELQILTLIGLGHTQEQIAERLVISNNTVRAHLEHVRTKLDAHNRAQLAVAARNAGLNHPPPPPSPDDPRA